MDKEWVGDNLSWFFHRFFKMLWFYNFGSSFGKPFAGFSLAINGPLLTLSFDTVKYPLSKVAIRGSNALSEFPRSNLCSHFARVINIRCNCVASNNTPPILLHNWILNITRILAGNSDDSFQVSTSIRSQASQHLFHRQDSCAAVPRTRSIEQHVFNYVFVF